jgi:hypothetical protein
MSKSQPNSQSDPVKPEVSKTQPSIVAILIAVIGVVGSIAAAFITASGAARSTAKETAKSELAGFLLDQRSGALVGEIRAFAFGGERSEDMIRELRKLGWLECAGQAISRSNYLRLYEVLKTRHPWGVKSGGLVRVPDLRGIFLRGWVHGADVQDEKERATVSGRFKRINWGATPMVEPSPSQKWEKSL